MLFKASLFDGVFLLYWLFMLKWSETTHFLKFFFWIETEIHEFLKKLKNLPSYPKFGYRTTWNRHVLSDQCSVSNQSDGSSNRLLIDAQVESALRLAPSCLKFGSQMSVTKLQRRAQSLRFSVHQKWDRSESPPAQLIGQIGYLLSLSLSLQTF